MERKPKKVWYKFKWDKWEGITFCCFRDWHVLPLSLQFWARIGYTQYFRYLKVRLSLYVSELVWTNCENKHLSNKRLFYDSRNIFKFEGVRKMLAILYKGSWIGIHKRESPHPSQWPSSQLKYRRTSHCTIIFAVSPVREY